MSDLSAYNKIDIEAEIGVRARRPRMLYTGNKVNDDDLVGLVRQDNTLLPSNSRYLCSKTPELVAASLIVRRLAPELAKMGRTHGIKLSEGFLAGASVALSQIAEFQTGSLAGQQLNFQQIIFQNPAFARIVGGIGLAGSFGTFALFQHNRPSELYIERVMNSFRVEPIKLAPYFRSNNMAIVCMGNTELRDDLSYAVMSEIPHGAWMHDVIINEAYRNGINLERQSIAFLARE